MLSFLNGAHSLFSILGLIATIAWAGIVLVGAGDTKRLAICYKATYMIAMITVGLSFVFGLISVFFGPYLTYIFPWLGIVVVGLHNMLLSKSRKAAAANPGGALKLALGALVVLIVGAAIMYIKPF